MAICELYISTTDVCTGMNIPSQEYLKHSKKPEARVKTVLRRHGEMYSTYLLPRKGIAISRTAQSISPWRHSSCGYLVNESLPSGHFQEYSECLAWRNTKPGTSPMQTKEAGSCTPPRSSAESRFSRARESENGQSKIGRQKSLSHKKKGQSAG